MIESDGMLRHLAFFEELGRMDEGDTSWRAVSAGLVTMRLVDRWIAVGTTDRLDAWSVSSAREAIARVADTTPTRRILTSVVDVMVACTATDMHALSPRLMAYGQGLEYDAKWALAADVYTTIVSNTHPVEDADLAVAASLQLGFCWRMLARFDAAENAYTNAARVAGDVSNYAGVIRGRMGIAKIAVERGNLPKAEKLLDDAIGDSRHRELADVLWRALADRAFVAGNRGQHDVAIHFSYEALSLSNSPRERERILTNIATSLRYLGLLEASTDAHLLLAATAQEQTLRWNSAISLLDLAVLTKNELCFDRYRRELEAEELTPALNVTFLISVGRGYNAFHKRELGVPYLRRAIDLANRHSLNKLAFDAESALAETHLPSDPIPEPCPDNVDQFDELVVAIRAMKELAEIA